MGQTSSHRQMHSSSSGGGGHNNNNKEEPQLAATQFGNRRTSTRKSTASSSSKHYPTLVQPLRKDELSLLRDSLLRNGSIMRKNPERRPVTISELKPAAAAPGQGASGSTLPTTAEETAGGSSTSTTQLMAFQLRVDRSAKTDDLAADSSSVGAPAKEGRNEFYIVGDGYHRTDHCHYRSPNGDFHKLPSDSFHKMSEGCFVRMADGVFRRLEVPTKAQISRRSSRAEEIGDAAAGQTNGSAATNVKSQLMRFLKRSKSHTPATIEKLQKEKEEARAVRKQRIASAMRHRNRDATNAASAAGNSSNSTAGGGGGGTVSSRNNKIVVTMIENGGLPIVATSKAERPKAKEATTSSSEKAKTSRVCIL
ncbi:hypothetical protein KR032_005065 [Drosophila birchii]|nr:hypothetical protein KR032_005065 [Drosophila birchii]